MTIGTSVKTQAVLIPDRQILMFCHATFVSYPDAQGTLPTNQAFPIVPRTSYPDAQGFRYFTSLGKDQ